MIATHFWFSDKTSNGYNHITELFWGTGSPAEGGGEACTLQKASAAPPPSLSATNALLESLGNLCTMEKSSVGIPLHHILEPSNQLQQRTVATLDLNLHLRQNRRIPWSTVTKIKRSMRENSTILPHFSSSVYSLSEWKAVLVPKADQKLDWKGTENPSFKSVFSYDPALFNSPIHHEEHHGVLTLLKGRFATGRLSRSRGADLTIAFSRCQGLFPLLARHLQIPRPN